MKSWKRANGLICATLTPMQKDGSINFDMVDKYIDHLLANNIKQIFLNGSAAENASLTLEERKQLAEKWVEAGKGKLELIILHCGAGNLIDTKELAAHAQKIGVDCVAAIAPTYFKAQNVEALVSYMTEVAKACSETPFMYYHYPELTGINGRLCDFFEAASGRIRNLVGAKFTSVDLADGGLSLQVDNFKYDVVIGGEQMLISAMAMGIDSSIGIGFSVIGKKCDQIYKNFRDGKFDEAKKDQYMVQQFFKRTHCSGTIPGGLASFKACLALVGLDFGPPRLPILDATDERKDEIKTQLESIGFFEWIKN